MANDVTSYAAEGYSAAANGIAKCPYLATSDAASAWLAGSEWHRQGEARPTPGMKPRESASRIAFTMGRAGSVNVRGYADALLRRFRINPDNTISEIR